MHTRVAAIAQGANEHENKKFNFTYLFFSLSGRTHLDHYYLIINFRAVHADDMQLNVTININYYVVRSAYATHSTTYNY